MAKITLSNLAHSYLTDPQGPGDYALKRIDHTWEDGKAYALLGPSGCGKTTLLNIISGLLTPSEGRVLFGERDITRLSTEERNIAQVFQFPVVYDTMTLFDNLAFPLRNRGVAKARVRERVETVARMLDLTGSMKRKARGLTADAKQKISLGRGMVREDVAAILFDEPLTAIDPQLKWELRTQLKSLHRTFGHTMIYVTHDQTEALTFADEVAVMYEGEVVQIGAPEDLFERPRHTFVGYFIGSPGMNLLPARVAGSEAHLGGTRLALGRRYGQVSGGRIEIGIRPEFVALGNDGGNDGEGLPVTVTRIEDVGRHRIVRTDFQGREINAIVNEGQPLSEQMMSGQMTRVRFDPHSIKVYADGWLIEGKSV
ncbi:MAG: ABC transporter ATP-binding protein [Rhodospirillales bacterium]|nr:ABC transporter ATP-binding protein [Rhodospirillales bacterium]